MTAKPNTNINAADFADSVVLDDEALAPILRMLQSKLLPAQAYQQFLDEMLRDSTPLDAEFEAVWDANIGKLYEP